MGPTERETLLVISVLMHQRYETFADELILAVEKQFHTAPNIA